MQVCHPAAGGDLGVQQTAASRQYSAGGFFFWLVGDEGLGGEDHGGLMSPIGQLTVAQKIKNQPHHLI